MSNGMADKDTPVVEASTSSALGAAPVIEPEVPSSGVRFGNAPHAAISLMSIRTTRDTRT